MTQIPQKQYTVVQASCSILWWCKRHTHDTHTVYCGARVLHFFVPHFFVLIFFPQMGKLFWGSRLPSWKICWYRSRFRLVRSRLVGLDQLVADQIGVSGCRVGRYAGTVVGLDKLVADQSSYRLASSRLGESEDKLVHCHYVCVLILLYMCPHATICVLLLLQLILLYICPHTTTYVCSPYCMLPTVCVRIPLLNIRVCILLYMCPHTSISVTSYYYILTSYYLPLHVADQQDILVQLALWLVQFAV